MKNIVLCFSFLLVTLQLTAQITSGVASYYAPGLHGKSTSTGEPYDHNAYTCANKDYPVNTELRVIRVDDGRSVVVRVNDCGPHKEGRIIDLSGAAAQKIGLIHDGITQVRLEVVKLGTGRYACGNKARKTRVKAKTPAEYETTAKSGTTIAQPVVKRPQLEGQGTYRADALRPVESGFGVQIGAFRRYENAESVAKEMQTKGYSKVLIRLQGNLHQVVLGPFENKAAAEVYRDNLRKNYKVKGFVTAIAGQ